MDFELIGELSNVETIAVNLSIRENADLKARRWLCRSPGGSFKGVGSVRLAQRQRPPGRGSLVRGMNGIGKRKMKIKRLLD